MKLNFKEAMEMFQQMQSEMEKLRKENSEKMYEGQSGAGMVTAKVNGNLELVELKISEESYLINDKSLLEDLIIGAVNIALEKAKEASASDLQKFLGPFASSLGLNL